MKNNHPLIFCIIIFLFPSCHHYYYASNQVNLMGIEKQGEIRASAGFANRKQNNREQNNYSLQAGGSPIKHLGIQVSYFNLQNIGLNSDGDYAWGKGFQAEGGIGGYFAQPFGKEEKNWRVISDLYIGMALGRVHNFYPNFSSSTLHFRKPYIQPGIHLRRGDGFQVSLGGKFMQLNFTKANTFSQLPSFEMERIQNMQNQNPFPFLELGFRTEYGIKYGRLFTEFVAPAPLRESDLEIIDNTFHIGLVLDIHNFFKNNKKTPDNE